MEAGAPGDQGQDPGAGPGLTRDLGPRPPTLLSGGTTGAEGKTGAGIGAETRAWRGVEIGAWTGARTRVGVAAAVAPDPTPEIEESPDQARGKSPGRGRGPGGPGRAHRGEGRMKDCCPSYYSSWVEL